ncbi:MAG: hypothetical protein AAF430_18995 [Myxococcota bacterium]
MAWISLVLLWAVFTFAGIGLIVWSEPWWRARPVAVARTRRPVKPNRPVAPCPSAGMAGCSA